MRRKLWRKVFWMSISSYLIKMGCLTSWISKREKKNFRRFKKTSKLTTSQTTLSMKHLTLRKQMLTTNLLEKSTIRNKNLASLRSNRKMTTQSNLCLISKNFRIFKLRRIESLLYSKDRLKSSLTIIDRKWLSSKQSTIQQLQLLTLR